MTPILAWRFLDHERRLGLRSPELPPADVGSIFHAEDTQAAILRGVWGCTNFGDALRHGHGLVACRVRLDGVIWRRRNTIMDATELAVEWAHDATSLVNQLAHDVAEEYLLEMRGIGREPDPRLWDAVECQKAWLEGTGTEAQLQEAVDQARQAHQQIHRNSGKIAQELYPIIRAEWHARREDGQPMSSKEYALLQARADEASDLLSWATSDVIIAAIIAWGMYITTSKEMYFSLMAHQPERRVLRRLEERLLALNDKKSSANVSKS